MMSAADQTTTPDPADRPHDPWHLLRTARVVLAVHAHPDDETLSTGPLIADLTSRGIRVELVTATRGERGEVVPGAVASGDERPLDAIRALEIDHAAGRLGISHRYLLGRSPALAPGTEPRIYRDSGMRWIREGLAGPAEDVDPDSFTRRPIEDAVADLSALIEQLAPDVLLGYDDDGTYGHPDHVRAHHVTAAASDRTGVPFVQVTSDPLEEGTDVVRRDQPASLEAVHLALDGYRTQLTVVSVDETTPGSVHIRHVGGQDQIVPMTTGLRRSGA